MRARSLVRLAVSLALAAPLTSAAGAAASPEATIRGALKERFPDISIVDVKPAQAAGLYEVFTGDGIAYATATGDYLVLGSLMDTRTRRNLTSESMDARNVIDFGTLPLDQAIKTVKGDGKRRLAVFSDPDCPYCQELETELAAVTNVTIYTFLYPIAALHPAAPAKAQAIWCSQDRVASWTHWMTEKRDPVAVPNCKDDPLEEVQALGKKLRINSTPTMFLVNGKRVSGALPGAQIDVMLNETTAQVASAK